MDGRFRRHFKGTPLHVKVGYGSNTKTRFLMPDGFLKFRVSNVKELELLLMHNQKYAAGEFLRPFLIIDEKTHVLADADSDAGCWMLTLTACSCAAAVVHAHFLMHALPVPLVGPLWHPNANIQ